MKYKYSNIKEQYLMLMMHHVYFTIYVVLILSTKECLQYFLADKINMKFAIII